MATFIPHECLRAAPWKNGGGSTTEIAIAPLGAGFDDFDWRISLATITASGPFSSFPGIDRSLMLVDGDSVQLTLDGTRKVLLNAAQHGDFAVCCWRWLRAGARWRAAVRAVPL